MIQVFREAGYHVAGGFEDGVMRLEFPIDSTDTSLDVMQAREHRAEAASIQRFFDARSVAVIGASRRHDTIGQTLVRNLVLGDYQGRVYVVNPAAESVAGMPAYAAVSDIPDPVDVADRRRARRGGARRRARLRRQGRARPGRRSPPASPRPVRRAGSGSGGWSAWPAATACG